MRHDGPRGRARQLPTTGKLKCMCSDFGRGLPKGGSIQGGTWMRVGLADPLNRRGPPPLTESHKICDSFDTNKQITAAAHGEPLIPKTIQHPIFRIRIRIRIHSTRGEHHVRQDFRLKREQVSLLFSLCVCRLSENTVLQGSIIPILLLFS